MFLRFLKICVSTTVTPNNAGLFEPKFG